MWHGVVSFIFNDFVRAQIAMRASSRSLTSPSYYSSHTRQGIHRKHVLIKSMDIQSAFVTMSRYTANEMEKQKVDDASKDTAGIK